LFGAQFKIGKLVLKDYPPATKDEMLKWEKEHLGMYVSAHPLDAFKKVLATLRSFKSLSLDELGQEVVMGGIITRLKRTITKKNDPMAFFTLEDQTGNIEVLVFPKTMEKSLQFLNDDVIVQVSGRLSDKDEQFKLIAEEIKELPNDELYAMALAEMEKKASVVLHMQNLSNMESLNKIKEILQNHQGAAQVYLSFGSSGGGKKIKTQSLVTISPKLISELKSVSEVMMVEVE
jgi:DNA polymerase-3 subunit alpha